MGELFASSNLKSTWTSKINCHIKALEFNELKSLRKTCLRETFLSSHILIINQLEMKNDEKYDALDNRIIVDAAYSFSDSFKPWQKRRAMKQTKQAKSADFISKRFPPCFHSMS